MQVSVIIASKNGCDWIGAAIQSALTQTLTEIEVIVVDDGSTDGTADVVRELRQQDARVVLLQNSTSQGVSAARNKAIGNARGDWIAVLDDDDRFASTRLEVMISEATRRGLDLVADNLHLVEFGTGKALGNAFPDQWLSAPAPVPLAYILERDWPGRHDGRGMGFLKPVIRASTLRKAKISYHEDIRAGEDLLLLASLLLGHARLGFINEPLYVYSVRSGSVSTAKRATRDLVEVNRRIADLFAQSTGASPDFGERGRAWKYQLLISHMADKNPIDSLLALITLPPMYVARRFGGALRKRLSRR